MINIEISREPLRVVCSGHAGSGGESLVCCAVSALMYTLCEAAEEMDLDMSCEEADGYMELCFDDEGGKAGIIVSAAAAGLKSLARQYPGEIRIDAERISGPGEDE